VNTRFADLAGSSGPTDDASGIRQGVLFSLQSEVRPAVTETLELAERVRRKLMGIHAKLAGDPARVSQKFSGKDAAGKPLAGHRHAYILPLDRDGDGWLDHLVIAAREPLDRNERLALDRLESVWQANGKPDIRFTPIHWGTLPELFPATQRMVSATPFVPPRHYRKGRGEFTEWLASEVRREAVNHGLPEPVRVRLLPSLETGRRDASATGAGRRDASATGAGRRDASATGAGRRDASGTGIHWLEFRRNRKDDPAQIGYGFEIEFAEPVTGPVALGYGAHFGLGQFVKS
jgi:CRISPR-associated protein Csb2